MDRLLKVLADAVTSLPGPDYPPANIENMVKMCRAKGREDLAQAIMDQWVRVTEKYPNTRINWAAASKIGNASIKKNVFGGVDFFDWFNSQLSSPVDSKLETKVNKITKPEPVEAPKIAIPTDAETADDWQIEAKKTQHMLNMARHAFQTVQEYISYLTREMQDIERKLAMYGPGGPKSVTKKGEPTEMARRVPKWQKMLDVYQAQLDKTKQEVSQAESKMAASEQAYNHTPVTTVKYEQNVQGSLEKVLEFILNIPDLQRQAEMLVKFQQTLEKMESEKKSVATADVFDKLKGYWDNILKWASGLTKAVDGFSSAVSV